MGEESSSRVGPDQAWEITREKSRGSSTGQAEVWMNLDRDETPLTVISDARRKWQAASTGQAAALGRGAISQMGANDFAVKSSRRSVKRTGLR